MMAFMKRLNVFVLLMVLSSAAFAKVFEVKDIRIDGLQRVSAGIVFSSFPISVGDLVDEEALRVATRSLFKTGYFDDVALAEENGTLILKLTERPAVDSINIDGNKAIKTEDLLQSLKDNGLSEGQIFKQDVLEGLAQSLQSEYAGQGRYGSSVKTRVEKLPRNRVALYMDIDEGSAAAIKHVNIVGNKEFEESDLLDQFELKTTGWLSWIYKDDQYAQEKLSGDLERLESFYKDRGYLRFTVKSVQVAVSPDKESVYITINVDEGGIYKVSEVALGGELVIPEEEVRRLIFLRENQTFSQYLMTTSSEYITARLGNDGYAFAEVVGQPEINDEDNTAKVTFFITPGKRVYVRRLEFRGNTKTADNVLRREMRQMEGGVASNGRIESGKVRLERTQFVKPGVEVETPEVPGTDDQIDVIYTMEEQPSGSVGASFGYSQYSGFTLGGNLQESNFFGTGKVVGISLNRSKYQNNISLQYQDPYFTVDGVSAGFTVFARKSDYAELNFTSYETESAGIKVNFSYPLSDIERLSYGFGFENLKLDTSDLFESSVSPEILDFIRQNGDQNDLLTLSLGWERSTLNRGIFATAGARQYLSLEVAPPSVDDLAYYRVTYSGQKYFPLGGFAKWLNGWSFRVRSELGYGEGLGDTPRLPFYKNFYAGGPNSVRGFENNSLGPRTVPVRVSGFDLTPDNTDPFGGNVLVEGSAELIFPLPFIKDQSSVQASMFFDFGNVFDTACSEERDLLLTNGMPILQDTDGDGVGDTPLRAPAQVNCQTPDLGELRYSVGIGATWLSGFGPITFSISKPINASDLDEQESFQFSLGNTF